MTFTKVEFKPTRFDSLSAADQERLGKVYAQAVGELQRMAGMTLRSDGSVDLPALDKALTGKDVARRMRLKGLLAEIGAIAP